MQIAVMFRNVYLYYELSYRAIKLIKKRVRFTITPLIFVVSRFIESFFRKTGLGSKSSERIVLTTQLILC